MKIKKNKLAKSYKDMQNIFYNKDFCYITQTLRLNIIPCY